VKVLHLSPLWFPVARDAPGGIETFLPGLIAALEKLGCRNTLIASGDSRTVADLVPVIPRNVCDQMEAGAVWEYAGYEVHQVLTALELADGFDVIHSHLGWGGYLLSSFPRLRDRVIHTQHNAVTHDLEWFVRRHPDLPFTTVSDFQARKLRGQGVTRCEVIHNGIDVGSFEFDPEGGDGLFFIGRMEEDKDPVLAIETARALGRPLTLAGPVVEQEWFDEHIGPRLDDQTRYVGKVNHRQKNELFGRSACVLVTSKWDEPFGLVAVEALACGTPVVALHKGAMPEIIDPGLTGFLARDPRELAPLVERATGLDRAAIRARAAARFDMTTVAGNYHRLYQEIAGGGGAGPPEARTIPAGRT
jgi:glycosyltransferase involved in cell wall biosynthesis